MDWQALQESMRLTDKDYPLRRERLAALGRVLAGEQYDHLPAPFSIERNASGEYIPLDQRRPSVRTGWSRTVVDDSVSMLFGQGRWPSPSAPSSEGADHPTVKALKDMIEATQIASTMAEAATVGSVGSVVILFRVLANRPYFDVFPTPYLTPEYDPMAPRTLLRVTEKRKVARADLVASGYMDLPEGHRDAVVSACVGCPGRDLVCALASRGGRAHAGARSEPECRPRVGGGAYGVGQEPARRRCN